jgi:rhamnose utilization protein RhaD (predicted bifunctional aldolase and dehydrogenase)
MVLNRWDDNEAKKFIDAAGADLADQELALRVYTSQIIGQDLNLVLHGGGNTSCKLKRRDIFDNEIDVLHVKGSGWDLGVIEAPGLPGVRLSPLLELRQLNALSDERIYWTPLRPIRRSKLCYMPFYRTHMLIIPMLLQCSPWQICPT